MPLVIAKNSSDLFEKTRPFFEKIISVFGGTMMLEASVFHVLGHFLMSESKAHTL